MTLEHKYTIKFNAKCPADNSIDSYKLKIYSNKIILVEDIIAIINKLTTEPIYQEKLAEIIYNNIKEKLKLIGYHSNIKIISKVG